MASGSFAFSRVLYMFMHFSFFIKYRHLLVSCSAHCSPFGILRTMVFTAFAFFV
jgi:hypothetical protein